MGWMPAVAAATGMAAIREELEGRSRPVTVRLGYLLSGVRPDLAQALLPASGSRVPFGTQGRVRRFDPEWKVEDTLLPVSPRLLEPSAVAR